MTTALSATPAVGPTTTALAVATVAMIATTLRPTPPPRRPVTRSTPATRPRPSRRVFAAATVMVVAGGFVLVGPLGILAIAVAAATFIGLRPQRRMRSVRRQIERDLPDVLELLIVCIRSGLTPRLAVAAAADAPGPCGAALGEVIRRCERGVPFADAIHAIAEELGPRAVGVAESISACDRYGLPLEPLLAQLAAEARAARQRLDQADARRLPVRLSFPLVVCTLPSFVLLAILPAVLAALSSLGTTPW